MREIITINRAGDPRYQKHVFISSHRTNRVFSRWLSIIWIFIIIITAITISWCSCSTCFSIYEPCLFSADSAQTRLLFECRQTFNLVLILPGVHMSCIRYLYILMSLKFTKYHLYYNNMCLRHRHTHRFNVNLLRINRRANTIAQIYLPQSNAYEFSYNTTEITIRANHTKRFHKLQMFLIRQCIPKYNRILNSIRFLISKR